jgi:hypothetical protein
MARLILSRLPDADKTTTTSHLPRQFQATPFTVFAMGIYQITLLK